MDEFGFDQSDLSGTLITMEFGPGGRIQQLWGRDPSRPEDSEEFQFVCPPLNMGEEQTEDYFPGTILLGARTHPDDPWILSRNSSAQSVSDEDGDPNQMLFEYDFAFLDEIKATGRFYEIGGQIPQMAWDVEIVNRSRRSIEIGELGFPLALNNVYEGFPRTDSGTKELFHDRVYVHNFIGGSASFLFAQRMNGRPPGLLIFPGEDTRWEFTNHVPTSLTTPFRWEGIPIVYCHSRGTIEREEWPEFVGGHTSLVLEPGEARTYRMRFVSADRFNGDGVHQALVNLGRPAMRLFPSAVAPAEVGIALEVAGATPARFFADVEAELETDADEEGGYCAIRPAIPGAVKLSFEDISGRESEAHLLFTEPISDLIQRRADYIVQRQYIADAGPMYHAIVPANIDDGNPITDPESFSVPFGIESGMADALFLAEKNTLMPEKAQIEALDGYLADFLEQCVVNLGNWSVGALLPNPDGASAHTGRASLYPIAICLYESMSRVADGYGGTRRTAAEYREIAGQLIVAMPRHCRTDGNGVPLMSYVTRMANRLDLDGDLADAVEEALEHRVDEVGEREYPFNGESLWSTSGFEESFAVARSEADTDQMERTLRYAFAARSTGASWWWYASDKRWSEEPDALPNPGMADKGEMTHGPTTAGNSAMYLATLDRDVDRYDENRLRMAFGGMMGVWALIRSDGAASMAFCPDPASRQFGMNWTSGDVGLGLFHYLRNATCLVLPSRASGVLAFGCHFEMVTEGGREHYVIRPWNGIGTRIEVRHVGLKVEAHGCRIIELRVDIRKRHATLTVENQSDKDLLAMLELSGLWGNRFKVEDDEVHTTDGRLRVETNVAARDRRRIEIRVIE